MNKSDKILALLKQGIPRKDIAARLDTSVSTISHVARVAGIFRNDSKVSTRAVKYLKKHPYMPLKEVARQLHMGPATVAIAAASIGLKRGPVRRNPTDLEWRALELWLSQMTYDAIGVELGVKRQRAHQAVDLCCGKLGLERCVMQYVTPKG